MLCRKMTGGHPYKVLERQRGVQRLHRHLRGRRLVKVSHHQPSSTQVHRFGFVSFMSCFCLRTTPSHLLLCRFTCRSHPPPSPRNLQGREKVSQKTNLPKNSGNILSHSYLSHQPEFIDIYVPF